MFVAHEVVDIWGSASFVAGYMCMAGGIEFVGVVEEQMPQCLTAMSPKDFARMVVSDGVTSKIPFAVDVALTLKCWLLSAIDSISSHASSGVLSIKAPPQRHQPWPCHLGSVPRRSSLSKGGQKSNDGGMRSTIS
ncbi:hypothetical protein PIB30_080895 [Stylosanthes scabra]|uniref:Uncharacterized protein n=1 Tax=Stylosanthes scabra TaxID=79078 RepID=A0ABU6SSE6_9FABA|nr:hypothetical protein [Stylosanthes scabra]